MQAMRQRIFVVHSKIANWFTLKNRAQNLIPNWMQNKHLKISMETILIESPACSLNNLQCDGWCGRCGDASSFRFWYNSLNICVVAGIRIVEIEWEGEAAAKKHSNWLRVFLAGSGWVTARGDHIWNDCTRAVLLCRLIWRKWRLHWVDFII